jgi:actin-related protein 9
MDNIVLTGGGSMMAGAQRRLKSEMIPFNPVSDNAGDLQPRSVKFVRIPEYFTVLKEAKYQQYASWLGGLIVAKVRKDVIDVCVEVADFFNLHFCCSLPLACLY